MVILSIEIKYFEQDIVWEYADCRFTSVTLAYATQGQSLQEPRGVLRR
jgi:hypothetical protein